MFSIENEGEDNASETDTEIEKSYYVYVRVNEKCLKMEVDTEAAVSVISEKLYNLRFRFKKS